MKCIISRDVIFEQVEGTGLIMDKEISGTSATGSETFKLKIELLDSPTESISNSSST